MNDLFIKLSEFKKEAMISLDKDSTLWIKKIISAFLTDFPVLQNTPLSVTWKKKDTNKGFAIGTLNVLNGAVPIIIRDFQLAPLDVIMYGNMTMPLTPDVIEELLTSPSPFNGVTAVQPKTSLSVFGESVISPMHPNIDSSQTMSTTRDAVKVAEYFSIIDKVNNIDKESVKNIFEKLSSDKEALINFESNNNLDILEKLSNRKFTSAESELAPYLRSLEVDRQYIYEDEKGNMVLKQANSEVDYTWTTELNAGEAHGIKNMYKSEILREKIAHVPVEDVSKIPEIGDKGYFTINGKTEPIVEIIDIQEFKPLSKFAYFKYVNAIGGLLVDDKQNYVRMDRDDFEKVASELQLEGSDPNLNDYGFFELNGKALTSPFKITQIQKVANVGNYEIVADHGLKYANYFLIPTHADNLIPHEISKLGYYVPGNAKFVKLNSAIHNDEVLKQFVDLTKTAGSKKAIRIDGLCGLEKFSYLIEEDNLNNIEFKIKVPEVKREIEYNETNMVQKDDAGLYHMYGPKFKKYASLGHSVNNLKKDEAIWTSILLGASRSDVEKIANLKNAQEVVISNSLSIPTKLNTLEKIAHDVVDNALKEKFEHIPILIKEASMLTDKTTVDAILSLGLINKYNILEFVALIPDYERVVGELAKLLVMARLGLANLHEPIVKNAMETLTSVIYMLKRINTLSKSQGGKQ